MIVELVRLQGVAQMKILKTVVILSTLFTTNGFANDPDKEYQEWLKKYKKEYQTFVDEHDQDFANFLKDNWVETHVNSAKKRDEKPKPTSLPIAKAKPVVDKKPVNVALKPVPKSKEAPIRPVPTTPKAKQPDETKPISPVVKTPVTRPTVPKPIKKSTADQFNFTQGSSVTKFVWLGNTIIMPRLDVKPLKVRNFNSQAVSDTWMTMAKTSFKEAVSALANAKTELLLDDWGQAIFTYSYIAAHKRLTDSDQRLYSWFYLVKQGFDTRVSYKDANLYLMLAVTQPLYGRKYFTMDEKRFYFVDLASKAPVDIGSVYTYNKQHNSASSSFDIDLSMVPVQSQNNAKRILETRISGKDVVIKAGYNKEYVEFLDFYPQLDMKHYFNAELPFETKRELLSQLRAELMGKSELESLNFLLRFVQTGLKYQTDQEQFNYENYLVVSETIHYPYADCEDRSVLFAYLVKNLLGNQVVGVQYDGHIATAVKMQSQMQGDSYRINGETFWVADPTYINANVGSVMPQFKNKSAKFVVF